MTRFMRSIVGGASIAAAMMLVADSASAQRADTRWQAWLGCWRPDAAPRMVQTPDSVGITAPASLVCVVPGNTPTSVEVVNFTNGRVASRGIIEPTGARIPKTVEDCNGWETARWSSDNRRVMLQSEFTCANNVSRKETGILAMNMSGQWVQIQNLKVEGNSAVYVGRSLHSGIAVEGVENGALVERPMLDEQGNLISPSRTGCIGSETATPVAGGRVEVRGSFDCGGLRRVANATFERAADGRWVRVDKTLPAFSTSASRLIAGSPVAVDAIIEMARNVDHAVIETWLADRGQAFDLSGKQLVRLADAGLPPRVIDVLVALDHPGKLLMRPNTQAVAVDANRGDAGVRGGRGMVAGASYIDPWLNPWDPYGFRWRYGLGYDPFFFNYQYGRGYGYNGYYGGFGYGNGPIIVVPQGVARQQARAVLGSGYTRAGSYPSDRPSGSQPSSSGISGSTGRSSSAQTGSGSSGSSSGSSGGGRTAKARGGN